MKITKEQKGITLIALIITIVVLLILAVVVIREVQGKGIIMYAREGKNNYEIAQEKESLQLTITQWQLASVNEDIKLTDFLEQEYGTENIKYRTYDNGEITHSHLYFTETNQEYIVDSEYNVEELDFTNNIYVYKNEEGNKIRIILGLPSYKFSEIKFYFQPEGYNLLGAVSTTVYKQVTEGDKTILTSDLGFFALGTHSISGIPEEATKVKWEMWCEIKSDFTDKVFTTKHITINSFDELECIK